MTKVLVTYGSRRGGTEGLAKAIATTMQMRGHEVDCMPAREARDVSSYDAFVVGGALYAHRWVREARRFVARNARILRDRPTWLFSSGPLGPADAEPAAVRGVAALSTKIGARDHRTFGGRLEPEPRGRLAKAMAKNYAGDWRDWDRVRAWASEIARELVQLPSTVVIPETSPVRWPLALLCAATAVTAIAGGLLLMIAPDGSRLHAPLALLAHSPFSSFLIPGVLLLVVVGGTNALAAWCVARDLPHVPEISSIAGLALFGWIVTEMILVRTTTWLQLGYLGISIAIVIGGVRRMRGALALRHG
ncbi:MAG: flavodoxin domain-containing protein [Kofleriaceae bacterium]